MSDKAAAGYACILLPQRSGTLSSLPCLCEMKKILAHEFALFAEPGALVAILLVLRTMGAGGVAMAIAARGWPF
jgi:hypothetical protein